MTSTELIERALRLINPSPAPEQAVGLRTTLRTQIPNALRRLAEVTLATNLLRTTFTVTAAAGEASLAAPLTASEPLLLEGLKRASIFITGFTVAAQWKADRSSLSYEAITQFPYYTLENQTLVIRDADGLGHYAGTVVIRNAPYVPTLASVPATLEPLLVELLAGYYGPTQTTPAPLVAETNATGDRGRKASTG